LDRDLRRSAYISGFIHVALIVAAIVTLPLQPLATSDDQDVDVDLIGPTAPQKALNTGKVAAVANAAVVHQGPMAVSKPLPKPIEAPPPPPPPPPPTPKTPPTTQPPAQAAPPPPPKPSEAVAPLPPPPPVPPQKVTSTTPPKEKPKPVTKPPASVQSATHQQHDVKTPAPLSQSVLNTLLKFKADQKQTQPPKAVYNPDAGGAPNGGGSINSTSNSGLSGPDRAAIGSHVRPCWGIDGEAQNVGNFSVLLTVTTDTTGTVREAVVSPQNTGDMSNPLYFAFTQRAIAAVENYQCATLPLPSNMLGQVQTFSFLFTP
jgi:neural Wiskott-Aldrich syndrome protein